MTGVDDEEELRRKLRKWLVLIGVLTVVAVLVTAFALGAVAWLDAHYDPGHDGTMRVVAGSGTAHAPISPIASDASTIGL